MLLQPLPKPLSGCTFSSLLHFVGSPVIAGTLRGLSRLWSQLAYIRAQSQSWGSLNLSLCSLRTVLKVISISSSFLPACCGSAVSESHVFLCFNTPPLQLPSLRPSHHRGIGVITLVATVHCLHIRNSFDLRFEFPGFSKYLTQGYQGHLSFSSIASGDIKMCQIRTL